MSKSRFRFTIQRRLTFCFLTLGIIAASTFLFITNRQDDTALRLSQNNNLNYPSLKYSSQLKDIVALSQQLTQKWVLSVNARDIRLKNDIEFCHGEVYDNLRDTIVGFIDADLWPQETKDIYFKATSATDSLFSLQETIIDNLSSYDKFADSVNYAYQKTELISGEIDHLYRRAYTYARQLEEYYYNESENNLLSVTETFAQMRTMVKYAIVFLLVFMTVFGFIISHGIIGSIKYVSHIIQKISEGLLPEVKMNHRNDEIGDMVEALRTLIKNLSATSQFALKIGEGYFDTEFKPQSKNDVLGNSLLLMRENLIKADKDAELRKIENTQRNWASQGLAEFNELLRNAGDDMQELSNRVIARLVRYLDANMGGIYIVNDENPEDTHLELTAFYAYDRLKYIKCRINVGETLVGQCFQENETVYLTDLPKGYVHISGGLGEADPTCLVIVPLKVNAETFGIVELASFKVIEKYQVEFVEKIGETIASTISSVKININTNKLLAESHEKSEMLTRQEAEVHKNIETLKSRINTLELQNKRDAEKYQKLHDEYENQAEVHSTTLRKVNEKNEEYKDQIEKNHFVINNSTGYFELDGQGFFINVNGRILNDWDLTMPEVIEKDIRSFLADDSQKEDFELNLKKLAEGLICSGVTHYFTNSKERYFVETYTPIRDAYNVLLRVAVISQDVTSFYRKNNDLQRQIDDLKVELEIIKGRG